MPRLKKRADGRYVRTAKDPKTGKRIYIYGNTEREVNAKIANLQDLRSSCRSFTSVATEWWGQASEEIAVQTRKKYKADYERAVAEFRDVPIDAIMPLDILAYFKKLAKQGLAYKTVASARLVLNLIMKYAILLGEIRYNPCTDIDIPKGLTMTKRTAATEVDEKKIIESDHPWIFPKIALYSGMRKGEILALTWADIDFLRNVIHVTKSVYHDGDRPYIKAPKTEAGCRNVPLLPVLRDILLPLKGQDQEYIISDDGKKPLTDSRYHTIYKHYQEDVGIECTAHQLRKSFATRAVKADIPQKVLSTILGHAQISTTYDIYASVREDVITQAGQALNDTFKGD